MLHIIFLNPFPKNVIDRFRIEGVEIQILDKVSEIDFKKCHIILSKSFVKERIPKFIIFSVVSDIEIRNIMSIWNQHILVENIVIELKIRHSKLYDVRLNKRNARILYNLYYEINYPLHIIHLKLGRFKWRYDLMKEYFVGSSLLDVACGTGDFLFSMFEAEDKTFDKIIAIDVSDYAVEYVNNHYGKYNVKAYRFDLMDDKLPEYKADTIICQEILEHVTDPRKIIDYCIKNSKRTIFTTPVGHSADDPTHIQFWGDSDIDKMFKGTDYIMKKIGNDIWDIEADRWASPSEPSNYLIIMEGELA